MMTGRRVQFSEGPGEQAVESSCGKTWPKSALKCKSQPLSPLPSLPAKRRKQRTKALVVDIYRGYRTLDDINNQELLHDLVKDAGDNALMSWTVLNMILRTAEMRWQLQQSPELQNDNECLDDMSVDLKDCIVLIERASTHFDVFSKSADVLDGRVLSQIMRTVELLWVRALRQGSTHEISRCIDAFVERCVLLIQNRPSSKSLATIAIRVINLFDWSMISEARVLSLIKALGKTQLAFATGFASESVVAYTNASRLNPEIMTATQADWVPVVLRAVVANSSLTRSQSLNLLSACTEPEVIVNALNSSADANVHSDPLFKSTSRRMLAIIQVVSDDDAQILVQAWYLVATAISEVDKSWPHIDSWLDVAKTAFRANMNVALANWDAFVSISYAFNRYDILQYPFTSGTAVAPAQCASLIDSVVKKFRIGEVLWDEFLQQVFRTLGQAKGEQYPRMVLQSMERILSPVPLWVSSNITRILNVCVIVFRTAASSPQLSSNIWRLLVEAAPSRAQCVELLRFHYKLLSLNLPVAPLMTSILVQTWPLKTLTDKPKANSHSLLSLTLLPITSFGTTAGRVEYIERNILSHFETLSDVISVLRILLGTVINNESQQSTQLDRWSTVAYVVLNALSKKQDRASQSVIFETANLFASLFLSTATRKEWMLWTRVLSSLEALDSVLSSMGTLGNNDGFEALLHLKAASSEKCRIIAESMSESKLLQIRKATKEGVISMEFVESVARMLVPRSRKQASTAVLAIALLSPARAFVVAKPLLDVILETHSATLISLWNSKVYPSLSSCAPFVTKQLQAKVLHDVPTLRLPESVVLGTVAKRDPESPVGSIAKRPKRRILTGSVPASLSTPPPSSDPIEDNLPSSADELCSSPPRLTQTPMPKWSNAQERARVLKRVIMGLNMQDAMQGMKRSECEMIYNLLFRACVDLHTHLSETAPVKPENEINEAKGQLQEVLDRRRHQEETEIEEARLRQIKRENDTEADDESMQDDDELSDYINDDDDDESLGYEDDVYMNEDQVPKRAPILTAAERTLRLKA